MSDVGVMWASAIVAMALVWCTAMVCSAWREATKVRGLLDQRALDLDAQELALAEREFRDQREQWRDSGGD